MNTPSLQRKSVDAYIAAFDGEINKRLMILRTLVKTCCPDAIESISYGMPAYKYKKKPLIYFAAYAHHIGVYATPSAHSIFASELVSYKQGKGSVQFPLDEELPVGLIEKMIVFKKEEIESILSR